MSADNGIYVLESADGYRVLYAHAIDNMYWYPNPDSSFGYSEASTPEQEELAVRDYWKDAPFFPTLDAAMKHAYSMEQDVDYTEYGLVVIKTWVTIPRLTMVK